ncbi:hypothetical protein BH10ACT4_BH10ACT4_13190 [soil metagenome]
MFQGLLDRGFLAKNVAKNSFLGADNGHYSYPPPVGTEVHGFRPVPRAHLFVMAPNDSSVLPIILTQDEVAAILQVPVRTLEDWRLSRSGPRYRKIGRHVRYERDDVITWFRRQPDHA